MHRSTVRIETIIDTYEATSDGRHTTGVVKWIADGVCFPDDQWNDFVVVVANWWLDSLGKIHAKEFVTVFRFMDGPFSVKCVNHNGVIHGKFIDNRGTAKVIGVWTQSLRELSAQVADYSRSVLKYCDDKSLSGPDVDILRKKCDQIRL